MSPCYFIACDRRCSDSRKLLFENGSDKASLALSDSKFFAVVGKELVGWSRDLQRELRWKNPGGSPVASRTHLTDVALGLERALVGSLDHTVKLFRKAGDSLAFENQFDVGEPVHSLEYLNGTDIVVCGKLSGKVRACRLPNGTTVWEAPLHEDRVNSIVANESGLVASAGNDGVVWLWRFSEDGPRKILSIGDPTSPPAISVKFTPDGTKLGVLYRNETAVRLWDLTKLRLD